jgi:hypothetical protein
VVRRFGAAQRESFQLDPAVSTNVFRRFHLAASRIEQAELNTQERLLRLELRIAEWSEGRSGV